jgi:hypothetical protein
MPRFALALCAIAGALSLFTQPASGRADEFTLQQALAAAGIEPSDEFGHSVAIDGDRAIVGVPGEDVRLTNMSPAMVDSGAAYIFLRTGTIWTLEQRIVNLPLQFGRRFGHAVALRGNTAVITAPDEDIDMSLDVGVIYVFERTGGTWVMVQRLRIGLVGGSNGRSVALSDTVLVYSCHSRSGNLGYYLMFRRTGNLWSPVLGVVMDPPVSIAVSGNTVVAGSATEQGAGRVDLYLVPPAGNMSSTPSQMLVAPDQRASDEFGTSVAISGDRLLVGAPNASQRGAAYAYRRTTQGFAFEQKLVATLPNGARFGSSVALDGGLAAVGAGGLAGGVTHLFDGTATGWMFRQALSGGSGVLSVRTLAVSGGTLAMGATTTNNVGAALVFAPQPPLPGGGTTPGGSANPGGNTGMSAPALLPPIVTGSTVALSWSAVTGASRYQLRAGTVPGASNAFDGNLGAATSTVANGVASGSYFVRVHAVGASGESAPSNEVRVDVGTGGACTPAAPSNLRAVVAGSLVTLTWNAGTGATGHVVEAGSATGLANLAVLNVGAGTTLMANAPAGRYFVRVRGVNACASSAASNEVVVDVF